MISNRINDVYSVDLYDSFSSIQTMSHYNRTNVLIDMNRTVFNIYRNTSIKIRYFQGDANVLLAHFIRYYTYNEKVSLENFEFMVHCKNTFCGQIFFMYIYVYILFTHISVEQGLARCKDVYSMRVNTASFQFCMSANSPNSSR